MTRGPALLLLLFTAFAATSHAAPPVTVVLVRHAEKAASPANDPPLTAAGQARAAALADALRDARVDAIFVTPFRRTRETAARVAADRHLTPREIPADGSAADQARRVADAVRAEPAGSVVLVVGHSNTVPAIIEQLGGPRLPDICDDEFAAMFTVIVGSDGPARVVRARYGVPSRAESAPCHAMMAPR